MTMNRTCLNWLRFVRSGPAFAAALGVAVSVDVSESLAQVVVGPGAVPPPVTVPPDKVIVGSTTVTAAGATNATNVTSGLLLINPTLGPSPGPVVLQTQNGNGLNANGGTILVLEAGLAVRTVNGHAALANNGGSVTLSTGTLLSTTGTGGGLIAIGAGSVMNSGGATVLNLGNSTPTVSAGHGAVAESGGVVNLAAGTAITTGAFNAVGLGASGAGSTVNMTDLIPVTMNGRGAMGAYYHDGGQVNFLPGSTLQFNGSSSIGISVDNTTVALGTIGSGLTINLAGTSLPGQAGSTGLVAMNGGDLTLQNVTVQGGNAAAGAWARPGSTITLLGSNSITIAAEVNPTFYTLQTATLVTPAGNVGSIFGVTGGLPIAGLLSQAGTINSTGTTITVSSTNGVGASAGINLAPRSIINLQDNVITTTGNGSIGLQASTNGLIVASDTRVATSGGNSALQTASFAASNVGSSIQLFNSNVLATGPGTVGLATINFSPNLVNTVGLFNSNLVSGQAPAILGQGPLDVLVANGSRVVGGDGNLVVALDNTFGPQPTVVTLAALGNSRMIGDASAQSASTLNIGVGTGSIWTGAAFNTTNVAIGGSGTWLVTASSTNSQDVLNAGTIEFLPPFGGTFKTLTTGNYLGAGGRLGINTFLGTDGSPSDRLVINGGTASGSTSLLVRNAGGGGALTTGDGILVVNTINGGTTSPTAFALGGRVVAGPYEYGLFRGGSNAQAWYLRSSEIPGPDPDPNNDNPVAGLALPNYRSETSLYAALPSMALLYGRTLFDTLHERVGEEEDLRGNERVNAWTSGSWARVIGLRGFQTGDALGIYGSGPKFDYTVAAFQIGQDIYRKDREDGGRDHAGLFAAAGLLRGNVTHVTNAYAGRNSINAYSVGAYWTRFGESGWYLDGVLLGTLYDARADSAHQLTLATTGWGFAGSLEGGYPVKLDKKFLIEPQAQLVYQSIAFSDATDTVANVQFADVSSLAGRLGVRLFRTFELDEDDKTRQLTAWVRPNIWHEFQGVPQTRFSSDNGPVPFRSDIGGTWLNLNAGISARLGRETTLYANVNYDLGFNGDGYAYSGKIGLRMAW